ncbi:hypothetical protein QMZ92_34245 [Streptomyces sp. HNM0645]|uniref:hypothetical protein n=1 Tax=Streptomyces sp. HNM0645 TaxID=2782343 RepID=UPI0024B865D6|nr:hypothetical protein [Streptomyces sp. HNM0645]MDI9889252.1 hypothetical protein [Streptomyces sp. HNM0645]
MTWVPSSSARSVRSARRQAEGRLWAWGLPHRVDDVQLIVSELLTDAIRHGSHCDPVWHAVRRIRTGAGERSVSRSAATSGGGAAFRPPRSR